MTLKTINFHYAVDENRNEIVPDNMLSSGNVYLHGEAEDEAGFDIPYADVVYRELEDGVYPATFNGKEGYTLYFWMNRTDTSINYTIPRGLVVKNTDIVFNENALSKFTNRSACL